MGTHPELSPRLGRCTPKRRGRSFAVSLAALLGAFGCGEEDEPAPPPEVSIDIGVTGGPDGLDFVPLEPGGEIPLHTFGQGGTHALLAVRCIGLGNRAFVSVTITNVETGREAIAPAGSSPRLLLCEDEQTCDLLPLLIMTGALTLDSESTTIPVIVSAEAENASGVGASVEREAVLSTASL